MDRAEICTNGLTYYFMKKVLLFDFDGTIADSFEDFITIVDQLSAKYHFASISRDELEEARSQDVHSLMKRMHIPFYKIPFLARDMKKLQYAQIEHIKPIQGLPKVLQALKKNGVMLGIATSNGKANVQRFLEKNTIDVFTYLYTDIGLFGKDKTIKKFLKENNVTKEEFIYIGDEIRDIQACQKAGVPIASVSWGFNSREGLKAHAPDYLLDTPEELLSL